MEGVRHLRYGPQNLIAAMPNPMAWRLHSGALVLVLLHADSLHRTGGDGPTLRGGFGIPSSGQPLRLRGGFRNAFGEMLGEKGQCLNFSRGVADGPRFRHDPWAKPFNESEVQRTLDDMTRDEAEKHMEEEENWKRAQHVVPREVLTDKNCQRKLRACCLCGLLKTAEMWLEYGCENCPFLIQPGMETKDRVEAVTTAIWRGTWAILHNNLTDSKLLKEKFPHGVAGSRDGTPTKGLYCLGFWRGLPTDVVDELRERDIDPVVRLWNAPSAEYLNQTVPDREEGDSEDEEDDDDDKDTSLSGFIVSESDKEGYHDGAGTEEGPDIEEIDEPVSDSDPHTSDLDMGGANDPFAVFT